MCRDVDGLDQLDVIKESDSKVPCVAHLSPCERFPGAYFFHECGAALAPITGRRFILDTTKSTNATSSARHSGHGKTDMIALHRSVIDYAI